jgi:gas vesicle protein
MGAGKKIAVGTVVGGVVGYVTGLLTAPKSGKETRKDIHDTAVKAKTEAEKQLKKLHNELGELILRGKSEAGKLSTTARAELEMVLQKATGAKDKVREILSAIHEGDDAQDKDLQKAVKEASQAAEHLRNYLAKHAVAK